MPPCDTQVHDHKKKKTGRVDERGLTLKPGEDTCSTQSSFHWQKITKELATEEMTHQPSDPTQPPVPLPFSLTRSLSDCHFTSKGMFVMKALYLLVGLAYGSKRLSLFLCFSSSSFHSEQVVFLHLLGLERHCRLACWVRHSPPPIWAPLLPPWPAFQPILPFSAHQGFWLSGI